MITRGVLFRVEAAVAVLAATLLAARDSRLAWPAAAWSRAPTPWPLVTRFVEVPTLSPLPALFMPAWLPEKVQATVMMLVTVPAWAVREALWRRGRSGHERTRWWSSPSFTWPVVMV